jgi:hypothetical protein
MTEPTRYYARFSEAKDYDKLMEFYDSNQHKNVWKRDPALMKEMIDQSNVVFLEDEAGKIVASSITYPYYITDADGKKDLKWYEIGTLRSALHGFGLIDALVPMQTLRSFIVNPPSDRFLAHMETTQVQGMAKALGFRAFEPVKEIFNTKAAMNPSYKDNPGLTHGWHRGGIEAMPVMARALVKFFDNPVIENEHTGEKIVIDFSRSNFCQTFEPAIRKLAATNLGDIDNQDLAKSVKQEEKKLVNAYFH